MRLLRGCLSGQMLALALLACGKGGDDGTTGDDTDEPGEVDLADLAERLCTLQNDCACSVYPDPDFVADCVEFVNYEQSAYAGGASAAGVTYDGVCLRRAVEDCQPGYTCDQQVCTGRAGVCRY